MDHLVTFDNPGSLFTHALYCHSVLMPSEIGSGYGRINPYTRPVKSYEETLRNIISTTKFSSGFLRFHGVR